MENKLGILEKGRGGMTLLVVLAHINLLVDCNLFHGLFIQGWCGVDFFFVLSGFLMIWTYNERTSPIAYVKKRFIRIYPVYWMYTLVTLIMNLFIVLIFDSSLISWINLDLSGLIRRCRMKYFFILFHYFCTFMVGESLEVYLLCGGA